MSTIPDPPCTCGHPRSEHAYVVVDGPCGARSDGCQKYTAAETEPAWEYGFYDSHTGGPNVWYVFGLPIKTAEMAKHAGDKTCWLNPVIIRRRPGSPDWEHVTEPAAKATPVVEPVEPRL